MKNVAALLDVQGAGNFTASVLSRLPQYFAGVYVATAGDLIGTKLFAESLVPVGALTTRDLLIVSVSPK